jgi:FMN phosphatase YigB (HAD superfamily)
MSAAAPRWATFDCYGTLVDWNAGISGELVRLLDGDR